MVHFGNAQALAATLGQPIGPGEWFEITQKQIDDYAEATGDNQWIHVDVERARREAPGGKTIAHGYLLLSLLGKLQPTIYTVGSPRVLNVGLNKLRFLAPVPAGSRIRLVQTVTDADQQGAGLRVTTATEIQLEGSDKPAVAAEIIFLYFD
ncbi:MaoC family dehydratase [Brevundimonas vesicularis]|uniref:MaoC family dehydratase n=1 Tax=Brevundimonas vesicularis TaxID=41276 RepID=UPI0038D3C451